MVVLRYVQSKKIHCCNFGEDLTSVRVNDTHYQGTRFSKFYTLAIAMQGFGFACKIIRSDDNSSIASYARHLSKKNQSMFSHLCSFGCDLGVRHQGTQF